MSRRLPTEPVPPNRGNMRIQSVSMEIDLYNRLRVICLAEDRSFSNMISILVRRALKEYDEPKQLP